MTQATEAQKKRLAAGFERLAREALREEPTDIGAAEFFAEALFDCPNDGFEDAVALLPPFCGSDELMKILLAIEDDQMTLMDEGDA